MTPLEGQAPRRARLTSRHAAGFTCAGGQHTTALHTPARPKPAANAQARLASTPSQPLSSRACTTQTPLTPLAHLQHFEATHVMAKKSSHVNPHKGVSEHIEARLVVASAQKREWMQVCHMSVLVAMHSCRQAPSAPPPSPLSEHATTSIGAFVLSRLGTILLRLCACTTGDLCNRTQAHICTWQHRCALLRRREGTIATILCFATFVPHMLFARARACFVKVLL